MMLIICSGGEGFRKVHGYINGWGCAGFCTGLGCTTIHGAVLIKGIKIR
jgi:hypothetical protein